MGSSNLNTLNKDEQVEQLARASKQNDKDNKQADTAKK